MLTDSSKAAEDLGFKVHVVRAGALKGAGTPGTEITEEQLAETQKVVDAINEEFLGVIAKGRNPLCHQSRGAERRPCVGGTRGGKRRPGRPVSKTLDETIAEMPAID